MPESASTGDPLALTAVLVELKRGVFGLETTMGDLADGWQTVMPSHFAGGRLSRAQVEEYERQTLREWRCSKEEDWSGL